MKTPIYGPYFNNIFVSTLSSQNIKLFDSPDTINDIEFIDISNNIYGAIGSDGDNGLVVATAKNFGVVTLNNFNVEVSNKIQFQSKDTEIQSISSIALASISNISLFSSTINITANSNLDISANLITLNAPVLVSSILGVPELVVSTIVGSNINISNVNNIIFSNNVIQYPETVSGVDYMNITAPLKTYNYNYISNTGGNNPAVFLQYDVGNESQLYYDGTALGVDKDLVLNNNSLLQVYNLSLDVLDNNNNDYISITSDINLNYNNISNVKNIVNSNDIRTKSLSTINISTANISFDYAVGNNVYTNNLGSVGSNIKVNQPLDLQGLSISNAFLSNCSLTGGAVNTNNLSSGRLFSGIISSINGNISTLATDYIIGYNNSNNIFTNNLFPKNAGNTIGFFGSGGSASGGFYNSGNFRSTITQVIVPDVVGGFSNVVRIDGFTSTQQIFTSSIFARANISTQQLTASNINVNTLNPYNGSRINTGYLQPLSSNLFEYGTINLPLRATFAISTATSVITPFNATGLTPSSDINSTVRITNTLSSQNFVVSSINNKLYPYTSSLGLFAPGKTVSTYTIDGNLATTPQVLLSNISFPYPGNYLITQKNTITKKTLSVGAEPFGCFSICRGLYPSTFASQDGFNAIPFINATNVSTFNTFTTSITVDNNATTRNLVYYDQSSHNYTIDVALADIRIRYIPYNGFGPELGL